MSVKLVILLYSPTVQMGGVGWGWGGYGRGRLGFLGGGGGMSSASGSAGRLRFWACWAAVQRSTYSRRISLVTGFWMLSHTPGTQTQTHRELGGWQRTCHFRYHHQLFEQGRPGRDVTVTHIFSFLLYGKVSHTDKSIKVKLLKTRKKFQFIRNVQSDAIMENCSIDERSRTKLMWKSIVCLFSIQVSAAFLMDQSHFTNWKSACVFKKKGSGCYLHCYS